MTFEYVSRTTGEFTAERIEVLALSVSATLLLSEERDVVDRVPCRLDRRRKDARSEVLDKYRYNVVHAGSRSVPNRLVAELVGDFPDVERQRDIVVDESNSHEIQMLECPVAQRAETFAANCTS